MNKCIADENWTNGTLTVENWDDDEPLTDNTLTNSKINNYDKQQYDKQQKDEIEQSNQQSVHDLFHEQSSIAEPKQNNQPNQNNKILKSANDYSNFAKDCSKIIALNNPSSNNVLCFVKTLIQELNLPKEHLDHLFSKSTIIPIKKSFTQKKKEIINHAEIFGEAEDEYNDDYLHLEDRYA
jgi:hypothetical protein